MEFSQLEQFLTIVQEKTLSQAAIRLHLSQPALTRSIQKLEEELQVSLFEHKKNKLILNENGKLAYQLFEELLTKKQQVIHTLQNYDQKNKRIDIVSCAPMPLEALKYIYAQKNITTHESLSYDENKMLEGLFHHEYSIIVLNHFYAHENIECIPLFEEHLYLAVPFHHRWAHLKEISFNEIDGESVLLYSKIGFWNEICIQMIPHSHLLIQEDSSIFNELMNASTLPNFKSNLTLLQEKEKSHRIAIPIIDPQAHAHYYAIFLKENHDLFQQLPEEIKEIDWKKL